MYANCCQPFHLGELPATPLQLMRSRYSAYALCNPQYIIDTTHPANSEANLDPKKILEFCQNTEFQDLKILENGENTVTFTAILRQNGKDVSFTEKSSFEKIKGKWLYLSSNYRRPSY